MPRTRTSLPAARESADNSRPVDGLCKAAKARRERFHYPQNGLDDRPAVRNTRFRCRLAVDQRQADWDKHRNERRALMRARVQLKNAKARIRRLEIDLAVQRTRAIQAEQIVLDLWPKVPAEQRGHFNDDLELLDAEQSEAAE